MTDPTGPALDRRAAASMAVGAGVLLVVLSLWLVPWDWVPGGDLHPMPATELFSDSEIARAEKFAETRRLLSWSSYGASLLVALGLGLTSHGPRLLRRLAARFPWWLSVVVGALVLLGIGRLATLPFAWLIRRQNLAYDLTRQDLAGWSVDQAKGFLVAWVVTAALLLVVVASARRSPRHWFAWAGGALVALTLLASFLYPVVVEPLFNKFTPMPDGPLRSSILRLATEEQVAIDDVLVADASRRTTTLNAYVSGLASTRRVVVYDTMLEQMTPAEVQLVVAHELGHVGNHDVAIGTVLGAVGVLGGVALLAVLLDGRRLRHRVGVDGASDPAVVALVLALVAVGSFASSPMVNSVSRAVEARADRDALAATDAPGVFIEVQRDLALEAIHDPTPPRLSQWWFGSHPTVLERAGLPGSLREAAR